MEPSFPMSLGTFAGLMLTILPEVNFLAEPPHVLADDFLCGGAFDQNFLETVKTVFCQILGSETFGRYVRTRGR